MIEADVKIMVKKLFLLKDIHMIAPSGKAGTGWFYMPAQNGLGTKGIPDFVGHYKGVFFSIETKAPGRVPTGLQAHIGKTINESGGVWFVVDGAESLKTVESWMKEVDQYAGNKSPYSVHSEQRTSVSMA